MKLKVVMYGEHGGELDSKIVEAKNEDDCLTDAKQELILMLRETTLSIGDMFVIKEA